MTEFMQHILKNWPAFLLAIAGILAVIATYVSSNQDSRQKNTIEELGKQNRQLSEEIKHLNEINNNIAANTRNIVSANEQITEANYKLSQQSQALINEVKDLTAQIKKDNDEREGSRPQQGQWEFDFARYGSPSNFQIMLGKTIVKLDRQGNVIPRIIGCGTNEIPIKLEQNIGGRKCITIEVLDERGNVIVEIIKNRFVIHNTTTNKYKFNSDDKAFEVITQDGAVIFSIQLIKDKYDDILKIRGVFFQKNIDIYTVLGDDSCARSTGNNQKYPLELAKKMITKIFATHHY